MRMALGNTASSTKKEPEANNSKGRKTWSYSKNRGRNRNLDFVQYQKTPHYGGACVLIKIPMQVQHLERN